MKSTSSFGTKKVFPDQRTLSRNNQVYPMHRNPENPPVFLNQNISCVHYPGNSQVFTTSVNTQVHTTLNYPGNSPVTSNPVNNQVCKSPQVPVNT